jgi:hypothetical protein
MRWSDVDFRPSSRKLRQFAATALVFSATLAAWQGFAHGRWPLASAIAMLGVAVGGIGLVWPAAIRPVFVAAMVACFPIGWCLSQMMLAALFYGLFMPIGCVMRLIGRDALAIRKPRGLPSYWSAKPAISDPRRYFKQF